MRRISNTCGGGVGGWGATTEPTRLTTHKGQLGRSRGTPRREARIGTRPPISEIWKTWFASLCFATIDFLVLKLRTNRKEKGQKEGEERGRKVKGEGEREGEREKEETLDGEASYFV